MLTSPNLSRTSPAMRSNSASAIVSCASYARPVTERPSSAVSRTAPTNVTIPPDALERTDASSAATSIGSPVMRNTYYRLSAADRRKKCQLVTVAEAFVERGKPPVYRGPGRCRELAQGGGARRQRRPHVVYARTGCEVEQLFVPDQLANARERNHADANASTLRYPWYSLFP